MCFAQREFVVGRISRGLRGLHGLHGLAKLLRYFACFNPFNPRNPRLISSSCAKPQTGKPPAYPGGFCSCRRFATYRLAWRLAPPLGPLLGPLPRTSPLETSLTQREPLPL